jgi:hypothetical protein
MFSQGSVPSTIRKFRASALFVDLPRAVIRLMISSIGELCAGALDATYNGNQKLSALLRELSWTNNILIMA